MNDFASEAGHWYDKDGIPRYTYIAADGREFKTTLREAKKYGWFPSVSAICRLDPAFELQRWLIKRGIRTTLSLRPIQGEEVEAYVDRVYAEAERQGREVMDLGSTVHGCIECHLTGRDYDQAYTSHVMGAVASLDSWCGVGGLSPERSFCHPTLGYGGKCDVHKRTFSLLDGIEVWDDEGWVVDFKTKDFDEFWKPATYNNHAMQLSAYRHGFGMPNARCAIIFVSTTVPGLTHLVEVSEKKLEKGWRIFCALLNLWKVKNF